MKHVQEEIATELFAELDQQFRSTTYLTLKGAGVHWRCTAERAHSTCSIACYFLKEPEYYTDFQRDSVRVATARIASREHTIEAVAQWLNGCTLSELQDSFPFVDQTKRSLSQLLEKVIAAEPDLKTDTKIELRHMIADIYDLKFVANERSCEISYNGKKELPDVKFSWDKCQLFEFPVDQASRLAPVLKLWLCDQTAPSMMRIEFPWLTIGPLADYYENGNPIEGEFLLSWDSIEKFYSQDWCTFSEPLLTMIHAMRSAGYDRLLRVGQSLSSLGLSRSRRYGLRSDQASLWFNFRKDRMDVQAGLNGETLKDHPIQFTEEVRRMVDGLVMIEID